MALVINAVFLCVYIAFIKAQSENSDKLESCNVVCNCNGGPPADPLPAQTALQGPPGKLGPRGPIGVKGKMGVVGQKGEKGGIGAVGLKGDKGDTGSTGLTGAKGQIGEKGQKGDAALPLSSIFSVLSANSCHELRVKHGLNVSGYYPMRSLLFCIIRSFYCDFTDYPGVTSCKELTLNHGIKISGYYEMKYPNGSVMGFHYCDFTPYPEASSCQDLVTEFNLYITGYYLYGSNVSSGTFRFCIMLESVYTCQGLRDEYTVDLPSGFYEFYTSGQQTTFQVYCDFTQNPAVTEVHHDLMEETFIQSTCESSGCFGTSPSYPIAESEMLKLIDNSVSCKQFIKLKCQGVVIKNGGTDHAWWVSRSGEKMTYWGGTQNPKYCACGETGTCIDTSYKCNCDQNSGSIMTSDEGYLTDKTKLPIKEVRIGDMSGSDELAWLTIGKLECSGQV